MENMQMAPPHGLEAVMAEFGNIYDYIGADGKLDARWQADFLELGTLPFSIALASNFSLKTSRFRCHKKLVQKFGEVFTAVQAQGLQDKITSFGGCFAYRAQRGATKLSTHCWGIAVDLNCATNLQGTPGDMDVEVVKIFQEAGFEWGGDWEGARRDAMHFQFCEGY